MNRRIVHSLIVPCSMIGACLLFFCPLRASARLNDPGTTSTRQKSSGHVAKFQEQSVGKISGGSEFEDLQASNGHIAWVEQKASTSKWIVYRDGKEMGGKYDGVKYLEFSPDGEHLAFFGQRNLQWLLVLDGQERSQAFADVTPVVFEPRGPSWAFSACAAENTCTMVVGGHPADTPRETYDQVSPPQFSLDGKRLGFMVQFHGKWTAIVDGKAIGPQMKGYSCLGFSPDAAHFFVCGTTNKAELTYPQWTYFVDGAPGPYFAQISPITFSSDDRHYAYGGSGSQVAFKKDKTNGTIVLDGKSGPEFQGRGLPGAWVTLLNAPIVAAEVYSGGGFIYPVVLVPGHLISGPRVLSASLNGVSDPVFDVRGNLAYAARLGKDYVVVFDGAQAGPRFDDVVSDVVFTDDALHSAYVALRGREFVEVLDNQPGKAVPLDDSPQRSHPRKPDPTDLNATPDTDEPLPPPIPKASIGWTELTPHATHFAFEIVKGGIRFNAGKTLRAERTIVLDGEPGKRYSALGMSVLQFSKDEKHYWYTVSGASGKRGLVVVDGHESKLYSNLTGAQFDPADNGIIFFARRGKKLLRVTLPLN